MYLFAEFKSEQRPAAVIAHDGDLDAFGQAETSGSSDVAPGVVPAHPVHGEVEPAGTDGEGVGAGDAGTDGPEPATAGRGNDPIAREAGHRPGKENQGEEVLATVNTCRIGLASGLQDLDPGRDRRRLPVAAVDHTWRDMQNHTGLDWNSVVY